jgi:carbon-monoxide dehydrogenase small subunit
VSGEIAVSLTVNGVARVVRTAPGRTLLEVLRDDLRLTGTKAGCEAGECGACTVVLDGEPVTACLVPVAAADGATVETVEGLGDRRGRLHPVQEALVAAGGVQCGFCTPGVVVSSVALLRRNPRPTEREIREALAGNLCRCTGYARIVAAVGRAAGEEVGS